MVETRGINENNIAFVTLENKMFNRWRAGVQIMANLGQRFSSGNIYKLDFLKSSMLYFCRNKWHTVLFPAPISPISLVPRVSPNCYKERRKGTQNHNLMIYHTRHFRIVLGRAVYICALWWCKEWPTAPYWGLQPGSGRTSNPRKINLVIFLLEWGHT